MAEQGKPDVNVGQTQPSQQGQQGQQVQTAQQRQRAPTAPFTRWIDPLQTMDRLFDEFFSRSPLRGRVGRMMMPEVAGAEARMPRIDVIDREKEILVRAELPGVDKAALDISLNEDALIIKGETEVEQEEREGDYLRQEIALGSFIRTVPLPVHVDADKAQANFKNGILELTLPKMEESKRRHINVQ
jgi:HSP20 family protein